MRLIRPLKPFFVGSRTHDPGDPPVELDDRIAVALVKSGLAEFVAALPPIEQAIDPAPGRAEQAIAPRQAKHGGRQ
jgi:hypothetical protein